MNRTRIEVKRILSQHVPTIRIRLRPVARLRRLTREGLRLVNGLLSLVRRLFPKRQYLTLE